MALVAQGAGGRAERERARGVSRLEWQNRRRLEPPEGRLHAREGGGGGLSVDAGCAGARGARARGERAPRDAPAGPRRPRLGPRRAPRPAGARASAARGGVGRGRRAGRGGARTASSPPLAAPSLLVTKGTVCRARWHPQAGRRRGGARGDGRRARACVSRSSPHKISHKKGSCAARRRAREEAPGRALGRGRGRWGAGARGAADRAAVEEGGVVGLLKAETPHGVPRPPSPRLQLAAAARPQGAHQRARSGRGGLGLRARRGWGADWVFWSPGLLARRETWAEADEAEVDEPARRPMSGLRAMQAPSAAGAGPRGRPDALDAEAGAEVLARAVQLPAAAAGHTSFHARDAAARIIHEILRRRARCWLAGRAGRAGGRGAPGCAHAGCSSLHRDSTTPSACCLQNE